MQRAAADKRATDTPMRVRRPAPAEKTATKPSAKPTRTTNAKPRAKVKTSSRAQATYPNPPAKRTIPEKFEDKKRNESHTGKGRHYVWVGIVFLFVAGFLLLSCLSYLKYWKVDQNVAYWSELFTNLSQETQNWCGRLGAIVSQTIIGRWFGLFGILSALLAAIIAVKSFAIQGLRLHKWIRSTLIVMVTGSIVLGHFMSVDPTVFGSGWGGEMGIYAAQWLRAVIGNEGTSLLLALGALGILYFVNAGFIKKIYRNSRQMLADIKRRNELRRIAARLREQELIQRIEQERKMRAMATPTIEQPVVVVPQKNDQPPAEQTHPEPAPQAQTAETEAIIAESIPDPAVQPQVAPTNVEYTLLPLDNGQSAVVTGYYPDGTPAYCYFDAAALATIAQPKAKLPVAAVDDDQDVEPEFTILERPLVHATPVTPVVTSTEATTPTTPQFITHRPVEEVLPQPEAYDDSPALLVEQLAQEEALDDTTINSSELYDPTLELRGYRKPPVELLRDHTLRVMVTDEELLENKNRIVHTLDTFGIKIDSIEATIGPTVTLYEIVPAPGVRISKIKNLEDDIALALAALGIRIIAPIPGKGTIGIEVPNKDKEIVSMYSVIKSAKFHDFDGDLPIAMGKTIQNETFVLDLAKMPHLLVAGATGQGKSVGLNAIITSLLYKKHPSELKFILVDPKKVELTLYSKLENHFLAAIPDAEEAIITDTQKVIYTLNSICVEMDARYDLLKNAQVRSIKEYNAKFIKRRLNPEKGHRYLPYFVVIIDEFADLIMTAGREVETPIARIAQLARAVGIHLIIATQRPTTNIITGVIKANFPARIAFRVTSQIDSRTILDHTGANQLIGRGDMLISTGNDVTRVQCAFVDTPEVELIANHIAAQKGYEGPYQLPEYQPEGDSSSSSSRDDSGKRDPLFDDVAYYVVSNQTGSASTIQRKFSIGFNRAGRIVDQLEAAGILGASQGGSKPRQVLIQDPVTLELLLIG